jgi:HrpA-like RNA helicase
VSQSCLASADSTDNPTGPQLANASEELRALCLRDGQGSLTALGRQVRGMPVDPKVSLNRSRH